MVVDGMPLAAGRRPTWLWDPGPPIRLHRCGGSAGGSHRARTPPRALVRAALPRGLNLSDRELSMFFDTMDDSGDGLVEFQEFIDFLQNVARPRRDEGMG